MTGSPQDRRRERLQKHLQEIHNSALTTWRFLDTVLECNLSSEIESTVLRSSLEKFEATLAAIKRELPAELQPEPWKFEKRQYGREIKHERQCKALVTSDSRRALEGRQCRRRALDGSLFCKTHEHLELETFEQIVQPLQGTLCDRKREAFDDGH